jgi:hypothetical protein
MDYPSKWKSGYGHLLWWFLPLVGVLVVFSYYTPKPFFISYHFNCTDAGCMVEADDQQMILSRLDEDIDTASRLDQFSKPFSGFLRFEPRITNQTSAELVVEKPRQVVQDRVAVVCALPDYGLNIFSYGAGIVFSPGTNLSKLPEVIRTKITPILKNCFPKIEFPNQKLQVDPNTEVKINSTIQYLIEFLPDPQSKFMVLIAMYLLFLALLPVLKQGVKFSREGLTYFID